MNTDFIDNYIKEHYTEKRRIHTKGVAETAYHLAKLYGADAEKARLAALYHDMFRRASDDTIHEYVAKYGLDEKYEGDPDLAHGKIAALFMEHELGIKDKDTLNAVKYHTTAREGMSTLEKVIYLADAIEPARDYPSVDIIRRIAEQDLDKACLEILERSGEYLPKKGREMDKDSIKALDWFRKEVEKDKLETSEIVMKAALLLDKKKASNVVIIDIGEKSSFADYLLISTAGSDRQTASLADDIEDEMERLGVQELISEGRKNTGWVLLDYGDIIINIFSAEMREKYDLEKVWGDCAKTLVSTED